MYFYTLLFVKKLNVLCNEHKVNIYIYIFIYIYPLLFTDVLIRRLQ